MNGRAQCFGGRTEGGLETGMVVSRTLAGAPAPFAGRAVQECPLLSLSSTTAPVMLSGFLRLCVTIRL